ncbi:Replicase polyprotein 1ab [Frankliniella fusca]|uniref:Replicase polyprotein 1ab n=1 Tax=Frankliniella fusca TaxID=407009 RepID=A0AAE1H166_9NEOP|nr:Replicase polyprotein 1ab [Frankliniella fusca]
MGRSAARLSAATSAHFPVPAAGRAGRAHHPPRPPRLTRLSAMARSSSSSGSTCRALALLAPAAAAGLLLLLGLVCGAPTQDHDQLIRRVVLVEKHGFGRGRSVDISLVEAPGVQKLLAVVCKDSTLSLCQGFALDGKTIHPMLKEPMHYEPDDVFAAFFGGPYMSKLFGPDQTGRLLKPRFTLVHQEDGSFVFTSEFKDLGPQRTSIRPKPRNLDFDYLFIGAEVKIGVSDPVGSVTSF